MTNKLWNKLIDNLDRIAYIRCYNGDSFYLDDSFSEIITDFKFSVDKENELLTIQFVLPNRINENKQLLTGEVEYIDTPDERTYHRTQLKTFKWRK